MTKTAYSVVHLYSLTDSKITPVTTSMTNSYAPVFDPDGKYLYFLSDRDFNEVLGNVDFEFANPKTTRIYVATLRADEPSPFQPSERRDANQERREQGRVAHALRPRNKARPEGRAEARPRPEVRRRTRRNHLRKQDRQR